MPGLDESFNPGEVEDDGEGFLLDFNPEEDDGTGTGGVEGGAGGTGATPGAEGGAAAGTGEGGKDGAPAAPAAPDLSGYVKKEDVSTLLTQIAELRGQLAATQQRPEPQREQPHQPQVDNGAFSKKLKEISSRLYDPETADQAVQELLEMSARIGQAQAEQIVSQRLGSTASAATDLIIENFMAKKERVDADLYDEIAPLVEAELNKYDRSALAGQSRQQLTGALDYVWKSAKADVLQKKFDEAKERAKKKASIAPKLGGGKGAAAPATQIKSQKMADQMRSFAKEAGLSDADIESLFQPAEEEE